jgi:uncharacterized protein YbaR (Trm112 family)
MPIAQDLLAILACPKCKQKVTLKDDQSGFVCQTCKLFYPIVDDIPNFLIEEAKPL